MVTERTVSSDVIREINRQESPEFYLVFLTIFHDVLIEPIRVVTDPKDFILEDAELVDRTYSGFRFEIELLSDNDQPPEAKLTVQNIDRRIGQAILKANTPARLTIEVVSGSEFDLTVSPRQPLNASTARIYTAKHLFLTNVETDALRLTGTITSWDYTQELWPGLRATQDRFPGLFR